LRQPQRAYCSWRLYNRRVPTLFSVHFISPVLIISHFSTRFISQVLIISYFSTRFISQVLRTIEAPDLKAAEREATELFMHPAGASGCAPCSRKQTRSTRPPNASGYTDLRRQACGAPADHQPAQAGQSNPLAGNIPAACWPARQAARV